MKNLIPNAILLTGLLTATVGAEVSPSTVQIIVKTDRGAGATNAAVYIHGEHATYYQTTDTQGSLRINLPEGTYTISSAQSIKTGDYVDRFASREAKVHVLAGDLSTVCLHLAALPNAMAYIDLSTLQKMGINPDLAKDLN